MTLNKIVLQYVAFRKSMGEDFDSAASLLKTFCRRMGGDIELADITAEQVQAFFVGNGNLSSYWRRKYDVLRGLYRYAVSRGFVKHAPLPPTALRAQALYLHRGRTAPALERHSVLFEPSA